MNKDEFVRRIIDGRQLQPKPSPKTIDYDNAFSAEDLFGDDDKLVDEADVSADSRFAQLLLVESGFGDGEALPREEVVLGDQKTKRYLPDAVVYWEKTGARPFHILLFELEKTGRELLLESFFRQTDLLEDALHRVIQDVLDGFELGGAGRTADRRQGNQTETLCVVSIVDDRVSDTGRQLVCFGTKCVATDALEVFTLREEARDWAERGDRPLAEEHLGQLFKRHFEPLSYGAKWQEAFVSAHERKKAEALMAACRLDELAGNNEEVLRESVRDLLDEIAWSFGIQRKKANQNRCLEMIELPSNHSIAVDPDLSRNAEFNNQLRGVRIYDSAERLLGFIVYFPSSEVEAERLRENLRSHNHFHNVLVIYANAENPELELWQGHEPLRGRLVKGTGRSQFDGEGGVVQLLSRFFVVSKSAIEKPEQLAAELAWRARHLKALAIEELARENDSGQGPLKHLLDIFNNALASHSVEQFADAYAQTITYGMLAARWISTDQQKLLFSRKNLAELLPSTSAFLHDLFQKLVNSNFDKNLSWLLDDVTSLLARTSVAQVFYGEKDPSIHFYQDFLDAYDPKIRKERGVYYTPDEVVSYIVRTTHSSLQEDFGLSLGLADTTVWSDFAKNKNMSVPEGVDSKSPFVQVLDPALGTGTFLLRVIEVIHETMQSEYERTGLSAEQAKKKWIAYVRQDLLPRINGFELMMAPYIVSHLRLGLALQDTGFVFKKKDRLRVFLTNTIEFHTSSQFSLIGEKVAEEAQQAEFVKKDSAISVIVGNPPYERESASAAQKVNGILSRADDGKPSIEDFDERTRAAGAGGSIQASRNLYYYFWRWALWRVFERIEDRPGIVSLITPSSYLRGPGFGGMRAYLREHCNGIFILDLEGDQVGTRITSNVFEIKIPVCVSTILRTISNPETFQRAVKYQRVTGERVEKLEFCNTVSSLKCVEWSSINSSESAPLITGGDSQYRTWPALIDVFPLRFTGYHFYRNWPICTDPATLRRRWSVLVSSTAREKPALFKETRDRKITKMYAALDGSDTREPAIYSLPANAVCPEPRKTLFRSFDRQWCLADTRVGDFIRPALWRGWSPNQCYLTSLLSGVIGSGPSAIAAAYVPDCHHFCGRGGKDVIPLWRDADARTPNVSSSLNTALKKAYGVSPNTEDVFAYVYAVLANPGYFNRFQGELQVPGPRLPVAKNIEIFERGAALGRDLLRWHTYGERFREKGDKFKLKGSAKVVSDISTASAKYPEKYKYDLDKQLLRIGDGEIGPVSQDIWNFSVSRLQVVKSWLDYRMKKGSGKKSSPLDDIRPESWTAEMTRELLELLWVLEYSLSKYPELDAWLDELLASSLFTSDEIPEPTEAERKEPKVRVTRDLFESDDE